MGSILEAEKSNETQRDTTRHNYFIVFFKKR